MYKSLTLIICSLVLSTALPGQDATALPTTSIEFMENEFNFGTIRKGEVVQNVFYFTNTGTEPLIITKAKGNCGCTVPQYPKEPIMPGERASMIVRFNSRHKDGLQTKRVSITANTDPAITFITIKGIVSQVTTDAVPMKEEMDVDVSTIKLHPNPTFDRLEIKVADHQGLAASVEIYDNKGLQVVSEKVAALDGNPIIIDVSDYTAGTYTVSIDIEGKNRVAKQFIKQ